MTMLHVRVSGDGGLPGDEASRSLRDAVERAVGDTQDFDTRAPSGTKGGIGNLAEFAVDLLSAGAVSTLVEIVGSYLNRDDRLEFEFEGPGGRVKISCRDSDVISGEQIKAAIDRATGSAGRAQD